MFVAASPAGSWELETPEHLSLAFIWKALNVVATSYQRFTWLHNVHTVWNQKYWTGVCRSAAVCKGSDTSGHSVTEWNSMGTIWQGQVSSRFWFCVLTTHSLISGIVWTHIKMKTDSFPVFMSSLFNPSIFATDEVPNLSDKVTLRVILVRKE